MLDSEVFLNEAQKKGVYIYIQYYIYYSKQYFLVYRLQDVALAPPLNLPLTLSDESEATRPRCRPPRLRLRFPNSPAKKRPRKSRKTPRKRFIFRHNNRSYLQPVLLPRPLVITSALFLSFTQGGGGGGGGGWLNWLYRKGKNEAHLPDDKNKSVSFSCYMCRSYFSILLYSVSHYCTALFMYMCYI